MATSPREYPSFSLLARFGVPIIILLFYSIAAQRFDFTPDSTFANLNAVKSSDIRSLWMALISIGSVLNLDTLLSAKILSLFFSSFAILVLYLIAYEILVDHLLAFCATLGLSAQAWLFQISVSGSGLCFAMLLSLSAIFFMLRNEYVLSAVLAGLGALVTWQVGGLMLVLLLDVYSNSVSKVRSAKLSLSLLLIFTSVVLPWILYVVYRGVGTVPDELAASNLPVLSPQVSFETVLLVGLMFVGVVILAARDRELLRSYTAVLVWTVAGSFIHYSMFALTLPLIIVFAFLSAKKIIETLGGRHAGQLAGIFVAASILAYSQFVARPAAQTMMDASIIAGSEIKAAGLWLKTHARDDEAVSVSPEFEARVQYYSESTITSENAALIISNEQELAGYDIVFDPAQNDQEGSSHSGAYKIWRRK